jgi:hypothetical protein
MSYDPQEQILQLINEVQKEENQNEFVLVKLENKLSSRTSLETVTGWWGDLLIVDFDPTKRLDEYIKEGKRVLMTTDKASSMADPSIGVHSSKELFTQNGGDWLNPCEDPPLSIHKKDGTTFKMFKMHNGMPLGDPARAHVANGVARTLSNIRKFLDDPNTNGTINGVGVDFYDAGQNSILHVQHVMRNADAWGLKEGQVCISEAEAPDEQCAGDLSCCNGICCSGPTSTPATSLEDCTLDTTTLDDHLLEVTSSTIAVPVINQFFQGKLPAILNIGRQNIGKYLGARAYGNPKPIKNFNSKIYFLGFKKVETSIDSNGGFDIAVDAEFDVDPFDIAVAITYDTLLGKAYLGDVDYKLYGKIDVSLDVTVTACPGAEMPQVGVNSVNVKSLDLIGTDVWGLASFSMVADEMEKQLATKINCCIRRRIVFNSRGMHGTTISMQSH